MRTQVWIVGSSRADLRGGEGFTRPTSLPRSRRTRCAAPRTDRVRPPRVSTTSPALEGDVRVALLGGVGVCGGFGLRPPSTVPLGRRPDGSGASSAIQLLDKRLVRLVGRLPPPQPAATTALKVPARAMLRPSVRRCGRWGKRPAWRAAQEQAVLLDGIPCWPW